MQLGHIDSPIRTARRSARITCQVVRLSDFKLVADRILDISEHGFRVGPADPVFTGEPVLVSFQAPGLLDYIDAEGIVARVAHGRRPGESRRDLGVEIVYAESFTRRLLAACLRRLPPAPPGGRSRLFRASQRAPRLGLAL